MIKEAVVHQQVCDYIRLQYPGVIFRTDFAAGIKMTMGQAVRHKRLQSSRAFPDLFIAHPKDIWHGMFIELKAKNIYKKNGELLADAHLKEQEETLARLRELGFYAVFAVGFDQAKKTIDYYFSQ